MLISRKGSKKTMINHLHSAACPTSSDGRPTLPQKPPLATTKNKLLSSYIELTVLCSIYPNSIRNRSISKCSFPVLFIEINTSLYLSLSLLSCPRPRHLYCTESLHPPGPAAPTAVLKTAIKETFFVSHFNFPTIYS
jgi:hypothetical protein